MILAMIVITYKIKLMFYSSRRRAPKYRLNSAFYNVPTDDRHVKHAMVERSQT